MLTSYIEAAGCASKMKSFGEASSHYVNAGQCYKKIPDLPKTLESYEQAVNWQIDNNQFASAAKLYQELAELYATQHETDAAVDFYMKSQDFFVNANSSQSGYNCLIKAADLLASQKQFKKAIELYEKVASNSFNDLGKWSVKEYFFKALLCYLADGQGALGIETASTKLEKYIDDFPQFGGSREANLVQEIIKALDEGEVTKFEDAVYAFDQISRLSSWHTNLLAEVKKQFSSVDSLSLI